MAKKRGVEADERRAGGPTEPAAEETGPATPARAADRPGGATPPAGRPAVTPQSLERLRRRLKAKYH